MYKQLQRRKITIWEKIYIVKYSFAKNRCNHNAQWSIIKQNFKLANPKMGIRDCKISVRWSRRKLLLTLTIFWKFAIVVGQYLGYCFYLIKNPVSCMIHMAMISQPFARFLEFRLYKRRPSALGLAILRAFALLFRYSLYNRRLFLGAILLFTYRFSLRILF